MIISEKNLDIWYREYLNQRERTAKYIKSRGGQIRSTKPLSRSDFEVDFKSEVEDNPKKTAKNIAKKMAKDDLFILTHRQSEKLSEAHVKEFGGKSNISFIMKYRLGLITDSWDVIESRRQELFSEGYNTYRANITIGQEFFGSEVKH